MRQYLITDILSKELEVPSFELQDKISSLGAELEKELYPYGEVYPIHDDWVQGAIFYPDKGVHKTLIKKIAKSYQFKVS